MKTENTAEKVISALKSSGKTVCTAESCTGGLLGKLLTDIPGSSAAYLGGVISYTNAVKQRLLHVSEHTLSRFTAVSEQTASEMAIGVRRLLGADYALSVTGLAGPDGDGSGRAVGLVYVGLCSETVCRVIELHLCGSRDEIRRAAAEAAFNMLSEELL